MAEERIEVVIDDGSEPPARASRDDSAIADIERQTQRAAAEVEAYRREIAATRAEIAQTRRQQLEGGIEALRNMSSAAKEKYRAAMDNADYAAAAEAQQELAANEARLAQYEQHANYMRLAPQHSTPQPSSDPIEQFIASRSQPTQQWLRQHREWLSDERRQAKLSSAHYDAIAHDLAPDSDQYFRHVESYLGMRGKGGGETHRSSRRSSVDTSKVRQNDPHSHAINGGDSIYLTPGEVRAATEIITWGPNKYGHDPNAFIGTKEYARRKRAMLKQGRYDHLS
jgi:hypothetical protein